MIGNGDMDFEFDGSVYEDLPKDTRIQGSLIQYNFFYFDMYDVIKKTNSGVFISTQ